jgi:hypothetical protein
MERVSGFNEQDKIQTNDDLSHLVLFVFQPLFQETVRTGYWWLGGRRRGGLGDYYEFERFSVGLELHFILVERELDRCI